MISWYMRHKIPHHKDTASDCSECLHRWDIRNLWRAQSQRSLTQNQTFQRFQTCFKVNEDKRQAFNKIMKFCPKKECRSVNSSRSVLIFFKLKLICKKWFGFTAGFIICIKVFIFGNIYYFTMLTTINTQVSHMFEGQHDDGNILIKKNKEIIEAFNNNFTNNTKMDSLQTANIQLMRPLTNSQIAHKALNKSTTE